MLPIYAVAMTRGGRRRTSVPLLGPEEQRAWLEAIAESVDNAIIGKRLDGTITMWSAGAAQMYGYSWEEAVGRPIDMLVPDEQRSELEGIFERLRSGHHVTPFETVRVRKDGALVHVSLTVSPVRDARGRPVGAWAIARDVTAQRHAREQMQQARVLAEQASLAKDRFLAVLSHELRTPLTPVVAAVQILSERTDLDAELDEGLRIIKRNVELEARLIDDLLDLTRVSRGKLTLDLESADAAALLRDALEICAPSLAEAELRLVVEVEPGEHRVRADAARIRQVFWNLLHNAAKFTPAGGQVRVACARAGEQVVIEVEDQGVGIPPDRLAAIFGAFEQGWSGDGLRSGGLGLGLAICRALVSLHGGTIEASSEGVGHGARFVVRLPAVPDRPSQAPAQAIDRSPSPEPPLRILLVEDHEDTALLMKTLLERSGHRVAVADSVRAALPRAREIDPDVVVSDLGLADGTGIDVLRELRAGGIDAPAIALSGFGMEEDVRRSLEAGFVEHLVKPVGVKRVAEVIRRVARRAGDPDPR